jgi:aminoglycoside/choline kinase family phosphotransferase
MKTIKENLIKLFLEQFGVIPERVIPLPRSGSDRKYFRMSAENLSAIGVFNNNQKENAAFISFTKSFTNLGLNVPKIYSEKLSDKIYLLEDLGDQSLFKLVEEKRSDNSFPQSLIDKYQRALKHLLKFQIEAKDKIDFSICYPRASFDKQSVMWDLNYFKYYFLKLANINFDEQALEDDFDLLSIFLSGAKNNFFMYRDFQSRNIMIKNDELYFIDYQGGRKGALQYDVASLLLESKANIPFELRDELLNFYLNELKRYFPVNENEFRKFYKGFALIRILQAMGAYGFRGYFEKKDHFLKSIPFAIKNLEVIISQDFPLELSELQKAFIQIIESEKLKSISESIQTSGNLTVTIKSFSYRKGMPEDDAGNGGGYVFDCRLLHNPGRYDEFKKLTGKDQPVIDFLLSQTDALEFTNNVYSIIDRAVNNYLKNNYTNLLVSFGCTGGQHRSVFCAEELAKHLIEKFDIKIELQHTEMSDWLQQ